MKLYSEACERNREPIHGVLKKILPERCDILEIGSGTGQHADFFTALEPLWRWQPAELPGAGASVAAYQAGARRPNFLPPIEFDLESEVPPPGRFDAVCAINVVHIAPWSSTLRLIDLALEVLNPEGILYLYGPFRYRNRPLETGNAAFDHYLRNNDPRSGIRCFDEINEYALASGFVAGGDLPMPANNRSGWWIRQRTAGNG